MNIYSPWWFNMHSALAEKDRVPLYKAESGGYHFEIFDLTGSCWLVVTWPDSGRIAFRLAYSPGGELRIKAQGNENGLQLHIDSQIGNYKVILVFPSAQQPVLRYTTILTPATPLIFPFWPRDIIPLGPAEDRLAKGTVYAKQVGARSGQLYFSQANAGSVFYLQNLTALADYNQETETSASETVGGEWPEIGFALPATNKNKPLEAGKKYVISDALITFSEDIPRDEKAMVRQYLDLYTRDYHAIGQAISRYQRDENIPSRRNTEECL